MGFFHIDIVKVRTVEGKSHFFAAIGGTSKPVIPQLFSRATMATARTFLIHLIKAVPYKIHTVLTDNGIQFADPPLPILRDHPWTGDQVERMNRTLKEALIHRIIRHMVSLRNTWPLLSMPIILPSV